MVLNDQRRRIVRSGHERMQGPGAFRSAHIAGVEDAGRPLIGQTDVDLMTGKERPSPVALIKASFRVQNS
jgi:hypothetical protein